RGAVGNLADLNEEDGTGELVDNHSSIDGGSSAAGRSESVEDAQLLEHIDLSDDGREVRFSRYNNPTPCGDTTAESEGNAGPNGTNTSLDTEASRRNTLQKESAQPPLGSDGSSTLAVDGSSGASCLHGNDGNCDA
ncbi:unnamed protein product, partial [Sphacelaria rigidula]